jgi:hypothetical protein
MAPKGGRFQSRTGNHGLKRLLMRLNLLLLLLLGTSTKGLIWSLEISLSIPLYLLLPSVFSRLDSFLCWFLRLDALDSPFENRSFLALLDQLLHHTFVPWIRYLGFTTRGKKGPLTMTGDLSACKSTWSLIRLYTVNKPLFWRRCRGTSDQDSIFYCFLCNFQFSFSFSFCIY